jgi:cob(I)alamin adenosyltransferase
MKEYVNHLSKADPTKSNKKINSQNLKVVEKMIKKTNSKIYGIEEKILGCN